MSAATKPMLRWSSVRSCPRKAVYEWEGAPARERTGQEEGYLWRGKSIGRDYTAFLATQMGVKVWVDSGHDYWVPPELRAIDRETAGLVCEVKIEWPVGVGHADIWIPETRTIVEILSSANASEEMRRSKLLQAVGYTEHHSGAENCALVVIDPSDFTQERIVLVKHSRLYQELLAGMEERIGQLAKWADEGTVPARVCGKPSEARGHFCMHAAHCFEGWTEPPLEEITADETLVDAVVEFDVVKRARAELSREDRTLERKQKEVQALIEAAELPAGVKVQVGPFAVTRTFVQRKPTFQAEKAEAAGLFDPVLYDHEFWKPGAAYSTFKAERIDVSGGEFGDEAPWTSEQLDADAVQT